MTKDEQVIRGTEGAWLEWLEMHPVTVTDIVQEAVGKAVERWLNSHSEEIIERIAVTLSKEGLDL